jgi:hypothetical protein
MRGQRVTGEIYVFWARARVRRIGVLHYRLSEVGVLALHVFRETVAGGVPEEAAAVAQRRLTSWIDQFA